MDGQKNEMVIFQTENGGLEIQKDLSGDTVWASLVQIAELYERDKSVISRHISGIYRRKELNEKSTVAENATVQTEGNRKVKRTITFYNLDLILSVGYRVNSKVAIRFRQWATDILRQHITKGFTINSNIIEKNKDQFIKTLEDLKLLAEHNSTLEIDDILSLIQSFSNTWFSLEKYDKNEFPKQGIEEDIRLSAEDLIEDIKQLKTELIRKGEASELFAQEKKIGNMKGIFSSVFQSVFGQDAYSSVEEKAAHLLYFTIKNHPFTDGNKRSGAFSFIWLLQKAGISVERKITPETLTTLTILIAESNPQEKDKMVGLITLLLSSN